MSPAVTDIVDACIAKARADPKRVVFPEGDDERIVAAAKRLVDEGIAQPIVLSRGKALAGIATVDPETSARNAAYAEL